jgi:DinB family protein
MNRACAPAGDIVSGASAILDALERQMRSLRELIETVPEHTFRSTSSVSSGSLGEHVRHCLDHVRALTSAAGGDEISYDSRLRGTPVETDPVAAIEEIDRQIDALNGLTDAALARRLILRTVMRTGHVPVCVRTTIEREAVFVVQHTIHHCATMAVLLERMRISVPQGFGYAPSTPQSRRRSDAPR